jgi:hypothetical protein
MFLRHFAALILENTMMFTVTVDFAKNGYFEFATDSIFQLAEMAQMLGNLDVVDEDEDFGDDEFDIPEEISHHFDDGEEYIYDEDAECYCWYDEEHEAWYWLDIETGEWLLVEDVEGFEVEAEDE